MKTLKSSSKSVVIAASNIFVGLSLGFTVSGCVTNTFTVTSEPPQAEVFVQVPTTGDAAAAATPDAAGKIAEVKVERKSLGRTPLSMPMSEVKAIMGDSINSGQYFPVTIEKTGFKTETLQIPASKYGTLLTSIDVKLKEGVQALEEKTARAVIDHLFLAQKYALTQQFERAHIELDKVIADFPTFPRALSMRASIYFAQKNMNESLKWYEEALKSDPQMDDAVRMAAKIRAIQSGRLPAEAGAQKRTKSGTP